MPSYYIRDVGAGARVAQGENISWVEGVTSLPDGLSLARQFDAWRVRTDQLDGRQPEIAERQGQAAGIDRASGRGPDVCTAEPLLGRHTPLNATEPPEQPFGVRRQPCWQATEQAEQN